MRKEVMSSAGLEAFAEYGLIIFVCVFIAIFLRALLMRREEVERLSNLPLEGDQPDQIMKEVA